MFFTDVTEKNRATSLRLLIGVSTPKSLMDLMSLPHSEQVLNSKRAIAESLSTRSNDKIQFDLCLDGIDNYCVQGIHKHLSY